jgi:hypothetical protein
MRAETKKISLLSPRQADLHPQRKENPVDFVSFVEFLLYLGLAILHLYQMLNGG